jgi:hypothetical protein
MIWTTKCRRLELLMVSPKVAGDAWVRTVRNGASPGRLKGNPCSGPASIERLIQRNGHRARVPKLPACRDECGPLGRSLAQERTHDFPDSKRSRFGGDLRRGHRVAGRKRAHPGRQGLHPAQR